MRRTDLSLSASSTALFGTGLDYTDAFLFNEQLTDDERMLSENVRAYSQEKLMPRVIEATRKECKNSVLPYLYIYN